MLRKKAGQPQSVFNTIMRPLRMLLIGQALLLALVLLGSGVFTRLNQSYERSVEQQVRSRAGYLSSSLTGWADLERLTEVINAAAEEMLSCGELSLDTLDSQPEACAPLVNRILNDLLTTLYSKRVSGVFLVFNTQDMSGFSDTDPIAAKTGVCVINSDPTSAAPIRHANLLWSCAPVSVVRSMDIAVDAGWQQRFSFPEDGGFSSRAFFLEPARAAFAAGRIDNAGDYGYWCLTTQGSEDDSLGYVTYSVPLVLSDGTVYGVLGIQLFNAYLQTLLPSSELIESGEGAYLLAVAGEEAGALDAVEPILSRCSGNVPDPGQEITLTPCRDGYRFYTNDGTSFFLSAAQIPLYSADTPYADQHWLLLGAVPTRQLHGFSYHLGLLLLAEIIIMLVSGIAGGYYISCRLSDPIRALSNEVRLLRGGKSIPDLSRTGIWEIDQFSDAITTLSRRVIDDSSRFLQILRLASVELGGFEIRADEHSVFVTDNLFAMLDLPPVSPEELTVSAFLDRMRLLNERYACDQRPDNSRVYTIPTDPPRYIRVKVTDLDNRRVGVAEDVTATILERMKVEHERDYDLLTGLYNRRAFYTQAESLFADSKAMGHGALLMLDLDNLKFINDHFGHDCGDSYIRQAARCFAASVPPGTVCARVSGDEFFLLLHGFRDRESIRLAIHRFSEAVSQERFLQPDGKQLTLSASGGVAWYPEDSQDFRELMRFADFAMYQVKRTQKGRVAEFSMGSFNEETYAFQAHWEFRQLIEEQKVFFHFQPIVDSHTGGVFAYEALMRSDYPTLRTPTEILRVARELNMLQQIECLTWLKAPEAYRALRDQGLAVPDALLFVNSIASQAMPPEMEARYAREFGDLAPRIVVEFTESEEMSPEMLERKRSAIAGYHAFALDDYGSGYNSERNLLLINPEYVKVDIAIIRGIDADPDKQHIVANIVSYAHERNKRVVAEGVETVAEMLTVLKLGVDLLQGFALARPSPVLSAVPADMLETIRQFWASQPGEEI
ncbi:MAG: EAL domain-containing protein [Faecousia sp.]